MTQDNKVYTVFDIPGTQNLSKAQRDALQALHDGKTLIVAPDDYAGIIPMLERTLLKGLKSSGLKRNEQGGLQQVYESEHARILSVGVGPDRGGIEFYEISGTWKPEHIRTLIEGKDPVQRQFRDANKLEILDYHVGRLCRGYVESLQVLDEIKLKMLDGFTPEAVEKVARITEADMISRIATEIYDMAVKLELGKDKGAV